MKFPTISSICQSFKSNVVEFCENPTQKFKDNGANIAGGLWNTGTAAQFLMGTVTMSPRILVSSVINAGSATSAMLFGHKDWGVVANTTLGIIGTGLFLYPSMASGDTATIAGFAVFCSAEAFGLCSSKFASKYANSGNVVMREIFGHPRRSMGSVLFASRLFVMASALANNDMTILVPNVLWSLGDLSFACSKEEALKRPQTSHLPAENTPNFVP